jgi:hypothetical protein
MVARTFTGLASEIAALQKNAIQKTDVNQCVKRIHLYTERPANKHPELFNNASALSHLPGGRPGPAALRPAVAQ